MFYYFYFNEIGDLSLDVSRVTGCLTKIRYALAVEREEGNHN